MPASDATSIPLSFDMPLASGRLHEWFVSGDPSSQRDRADVPWCLFADVAQRALASGMYPRLAWVGLDALPYPPHLSARACHASIVIDVPASHDPSERLWAIDLLVRSPTPIVVFTRAQRLTLAHTRRLQLAAASGRGLCLLARPEHELQSLSAATTRWRVDPVPTPYERPRWTVTLLRHKDRPDLLDTRAAWTVELSDASGLVHLLPTAGDGSAATARAAS